MAEDERAYRRQRRTYQALFGFAGRLMKWLLNYEAVPAPQAEGPLLVLSNHVTDFDRAWGSCRSWSPATGPSSSG